MQVSALIETEAILSLGLHTRMLYVVSTWDVVLENRLPVLDTRS